LSLLLPRNNGQAQIIEWIRNSTAVGVFENGKDDGQQNVSCRLANNNVSKIKRKKVPAASAFTVSNSSFVFFTNDLPTTSKRREWVTPALDRMMRTSLSTSSSFSSSDNPARESPLSLERRDSVILPESRDDTWATH